MGRAVGSGGAVSLCSTDAEKVFSLCSSVVGKVLAAPEACVCVSLCVWCVSVCVMCVSVCVCVCGVCVCVCVERDVFYRKKAEEDQVAFEYARCES